MASGGEEEKREGEEWIMRKEGIRGKGELSVTLNGPDASHHRPM
jgi:hypothetical protein